jgi:hypothetical protein
MTALQVNSLIICGGMAFTFKKKLDNVAVSSLSGLRWPTYEQ